MTFQPAFDVECNLCGTTPTVIVVGHSQPYTELCGPHFFHDETATQWSEWQFYSGDSLVIQLPDGD